MFVRYFLQEKWLGLGTWDPSSSEAPCLCPVDELRKTPGLGDPGSVSFCFSLFMHLFATVCFICSSVWFVLVCLLEVALLRFGLFCFNLLRFTFGMIGFALVCYPFVFLLRFDRLAIDCVGRIFKPYPTRALASM